MKKKICALLLAVCLLLSLTGCGLPFGLGSHEVRFELNGGTLVSGELLQEVKSGESAEAPKVEREGYEFAGWSKDLDNVKENMVAVAQWNKLYTITFDADGGELVSGQAEQKVAEGKLPLEPVVSRQHAEFKGWSPEIAPASGNATYVAQWERTVLSAEEIYDAIGPAVVEIQVFDIDGRQFALGSGFFTDGAGTLATNYHVIEAAYSAKALLSDGSTVDIVKVKGYDAELDLALLQADVSGNAFLTLAENGVKTGETVYALGSSQGLTGSFSEGIVSTARREVDGVTCIQTTAPISQGNSGGPLVNGFGEVVGINSMTMELGQNLNFAIEIKELAKLDLTSPLSLPDFYDATAPDITEAAQVGYWYDYSDYDEVESNDTIMLADALENTAWVAGEISDIDDIDCFYFELETTRTVTLMAAPYYKSDLESLGVFLYRLGDEDLEFVTELKQFAAEGDGYIHDVKFGLDAELRLDPGAYFLAFYAEDDYWNQYDEPIYYITFVEW